MRFTIEVRIAPDDDGRETVTAWTAGPGDLIVDKPVSPIMTLTRIGFPTLAHRETLGEARARTTSEAVTELAGYILAAGLFDR